MNSGDCDLECTLEVFDDNAAPIPPHQLASTDDQNNESEPTLEVFQDTAAPIPLQQLTSSGDQQIQEKNNILPDADDLGEEKEEEADNIGIDGSSPERENPVMSSSLEQVQIYDIPILEATLVEEEQRRESIHIRIEPCGPVYDAVLMPEPEPPSNSFWVRHKRSLLTGAFLLFCVVLIGIIIDLALRNKEAVPSDELTDRMIDLTTMPILEPTESPAGGFTINTQSTQPTASHSDIKFDGSTATPSKAISTDPPTGITTMPILEPTESPSSLTSPADGFTINTQSTQPTTSHSQIKFDGSTAAPSKAISTDSSTGMALGTNPEYATVQGFMWIDQNKNGLYETSEPPAASTFANLYQCDDIWVQTTSSNATGQYLFSGVEEGEYYIQFFRPNDNFEFTIPNAGSDDEALDSDVALLSGQSPCVAVDSSFSQFINAGYVSIEEVDDDSNTSTAMPLSGNTSGGGDSDATDTQEVADTTTPTSKPTTGPTTHDLLPFPYPYPYTRFTPWDDLNDTAKSSAISLGYSDSLWDTPSSYDLEYNNVYNVLNSTQQLAINNLGMDEDQWDCFMNHYENQDWDSMPDHARNALEVLGWSRCVFEGETECSASIPAVESKNWRRLNSTERAAATNLCWFRSSWDGYLLPW